MDTPPLIGRLTLLAERVAPQLARMPKSQRATLCIGTWRALDATVAATYDALNEPANAGHRVRASARFDQLKWYLRLLVQQRAASPGWLAALTPDLVETGKMLGGLRRSAMK